MSYLYGDSTPSPLEVNFVDFLGDCLDCCAHLLISTEALRQEAERGDTLRRTADADAKRLERLASAVSSAVKDVPAIQGDDHATRCAVAIVRSSSDLVRNEIEQVNTTLQSALASLDVARAAERQSCEKSFETLLLKHDLPQSSKGLSFQMQPNAPYAARLRVSTPYGVGAILGLDVPSSNLYGHPFRIDRVIERLEVQGPDAGGWLKKEGTMRPQRLDKLHLTYLDLDADESLIKLRAAADGSGSGFDVLVRSEGPRVTLKRVGDREGAAEMSFDVEDPDAGSLLKLLEKLEGPARELTSHRKVLVEAHLDDRLLRDHEDPGLLVERLIKVIAPVVQEIARRSPTSSELVLKRLVTGGRREEIFVTKAELRARIDHLPPPLRAVFDPLGLREPSAARPSSVPPPLPTTTPAHGTDPATLVMARRAPAAPAPTAPDRAPPAPDRTPPVPEARAVEPPRPASAPPRPGGPGIEVDLTSEALDTSDAPGLGAPRRT